MSGETRAVQQVSSQEVLKMLKEEDLRQRGKRLGPRDPKSIYGKVAQRITNEKSSTWNERNYLREVWISAEEGNFAANPNLKNTKVRRKQRKNRTDFLHRKENFDRSETIDEHEDFTANERNVQASETELAVTAQILEQPSQNQNGGLIHVKTSNKNEAFELTENLSKLVQQYENKINVFPTHECPICLRMVYLTKDSYGKIKVTEDMVQEIRKLDCEDFIEGQVMTVCSRCRSALSGKNTRIPPMAYMNGMKISHYPPEITALNDVEARLISQVKAFMKIYTLNKGRGQIALKGSCIHFPQDVDEIVETLPLSPSMSDVILINETDEAGNKVDEFKVRADKVYDALKWLKQNNKSYKDVNIQVLSEVSLQIEEIQACSGTGTNAGEVQGRNKLGRHEDEGIGYVRLDCGKSILHADYHQGTTSVFTNGGNQCAAMCASAISHAFQQPCPTWTRTFLNEVLIVGDKFYESLVPTRNQYLEITEMDGRKLHVFNEKEIHLQVAEQVYFGCFNAVPGQFTKMSESIRVFVESEFEYGIITAGEYCLALIKQEGSIFLFNSHGTSAKGGSPRTRIEMGRASVIKCHEAEAPKVYSKLIHSNYQPKDKYTENMSDNQKLRYYYTIRPIVVQSLQQEEESLVQEEENINREFANTESGTRVIPLDCVIRQDQPIEPRLEDFLNDEQAGRKDIHFCRRRGKPLYPNKEERLEELAFVQAFPYGTQGFNEERKIPITPLDYFQARIMGSNKAFKRNDYLFYALSRTEAYIIQQKIGICGNMTSETNARNKVSEFGVENVHLYMSAIRGSSSYWKKYTGDVLGMIEQLGIPTFFITISYDDLNSIDCLTALWKAEHGINMELPSDLDFSTRRDLLNNNPVAASRHFTHKMNVIMELFRKQSTEIFGADFKDFTYRVEFQGRGSPHVHMLLWLQQSPDWESDEGVKFIERNVSCSVNNDIKDLVLRYQNHNHSKSCYKQTSQCRFGFPRPVSTVTKVLDDEEVARNYGKFIILRRSKEELMINNYHPKLLRILRCNMDIQPVTGTRAIAFYIGKYISKAEPTNLKQEIQNALAELRSDPTSSYYKKHLSIASKILSKREIGAPEAAFRLCHLPLRKRSRGFVFVPTFLPHQRIRLVHYEAFKNGEVKFGLNIFDRYINRPDTLEHLCVLEFAAYYTPVQSKARERLEANLDEIEEDETDEFDPDKKIRLKNKKGIMHRRRKHAVVKHPFFNPVEQRDNFLYSMILLYYPFEEENFLEQYGSVEEAFRNLKGRFRTSEDDPVIRPGLMEDINQVLILLEEVDEEPDENTNEERPNLFFEDEPGNIDEHEIFVPVIVEKSQEETLADKIRNLNEEQRRIYDKVREKIVTGESQPRMLEFVQGGDGVGKSYLINMLTTLIQTLCPGKERALIKAAPTGVAARNIGGITLHKAFCLGVEKDSVAQYLPLGGKKLHERRTIFSHVKFIIIDEISMVSYQVLRMIHMRLTEIFNNDEPFGNINVILFGDLLQLEPCRGNWIFEQPKYLSYETDYWRIFHFNELMTVMRQKERDVFFEILQKLRVGTLLRSDIVKLQERCLDPSSQNYTEMLSASKKSMHLYPKVKMVDEYNSKRNSQFSENGVHLYNLNAVDTFASGTMFGKKVPEKYIPKDVRKCGGIPQCLTIGKECKVMLKYNADVLGGLCNGTFGNVMGFVWTGLRKDQRNDGDLPESVLVKFEGATDPKHLSKTRGFENCVEIRAKTFEFVGNRTARISRLQVPLVLSFACTVHKSQGMSLDSGTIHLGSELFKSGMAYVALSRVRTWSGVFLTAVDAKKLLVNRKGVGPCNEKALKELYRLKL